MKREMEPELMSRLLKIREDLGFERGARLVGVSLGTFRNWITGKTIPTLAHEAFVRHNLQGTKYAAK